MYSKIQRILAWVGIVCLLALYMVSFFLGISKSKAAFPMFMASLLATFFIPTMIYVFQLILKNAKAKKESYLAGTEETEEEDSQEDSSNEDSAEDLKDEKTKMMQPPEAK